MPSTTPVHHAAVLLALSLSTPLALAQHAGAPVPLAGTAAAASISTTEPLASISLERFLKIRAPGSPQIAPDGTLYVRDWPDGIWQLYRVQGNAAGPDSKMTKLTNYADGLSGYSISPDGSRILLLHAVGGNENTQISLLDPKAAPGDPNAIKPIVSDPKVQFAANKWLADSSGFLYSGNAESPRDFYLYLFDFATGKSTRILNRPGSWSSSDITADKSRALVSEYRSISDTSIYELTLSDGSLKDLGLTSPDGSTVSQGLVGYLPGEKSVLIVADIEDGMRKLYQKDLATGATSKPISEINDYEIDSASMNTERTLLAVVTNRDGYGALQLYRLPGYDKVTLPPIEEGVISLNELKADRITWSVSNARTPGLAYTWNVPPIGRAADKIRQVTLADTQGIDLARFTLPKLIRYKAVDGLDIPAFLFLPPGYVEGTRIPFIANYHGGPESQFRPVFSAQNQYLLAQGFGIIQPNVRGSTGYGRAFHMMDDYKGRWMSVSDGVDAAQWLVDNNLARPGRIATYGGSYGGFMSVATLVEDGMRVERGQQKEPLFGAGINVVGIVNMKTFLEQTSGYRQKLREVEYGPLSDSEFLESVSPINHIDKIRVPMLIAHGLNDPRVPVGEAMQLAVGLMQRGYEPEQIYFPDEGHGFAKLSNRLIFSQRMVDFLRKSIGTDAE
ncbi:MAG: S9 family peptidase [Phycisphaeraceae bacterium]|nr:MAG: S9 family peptidase [Phycisphaeraceae bacterium]